MALTQILVVADLERSRDWYRDVLGAEIYREYGGDSVVLSFLDSWLLLVGGAGPTDDKPALSMRAPSEGNQVSHAFTIRVGDCRASYEVLAARGAEFLTPPNDRGAEIRCFFRDPDGNLFEISEAVG